MPSNSLLRETKILALICIFDLLITSWVYINANGDPGIERNPIMRYFLVTGGLPAFFMAKMSFTLPGLAAVEWIRDKRPDFAVRISRIVIITYLVIFLTGSALSLFGNI